MKSIEELKQAMQNGIVEFSFTKKDGTIRNAKGTTKIDIIPEEHQPKGTQKTKPVNVTTYFDVEKNQWRSFCNENFIAE